MLVLPGNPCAVVPDTPTGSPVPVSVPVTIIHAPTPISVSRKPLELISVDTDSLPSPCPQSSTIKPSKATNGHDINVGRLSAQTLDAPSDTDLVGRCWNQAEPAHARARRASHRVASHIYEGQNKENYVIVEPGMTVSAEDPRKRPAGLGMGRDVGRNMGNVTHLADGINSKQEKDEKTRRTHLLLSPA
jgi:hypothetical protein